MAFSGREYVKTEWRRVPAAHEAAAMTHDLLEVREAQEPVTVIKKEPEPPRMEEPDEIKPRYRRKKTVEDEDE